MTSPFHGIGHRLSFRQGLAAAALACLALLAGPSSTARTSVAHAAQPSRPGKDTPVECLPLFPLNEGKINSVLDQPADFSFTETPLRSFVEELHAKAGVNVQLDTRAMNEAHIASDTPITCTMSGTSLREAIRRAISAVGLKFIVKDGVLLITSKEVAESEENLVIRLYPVSDLVGRGDYVGLLDVITEVIDKDSWDDNGGRGKIEPFFESGCLIVSQTDENHSKVLELLRGLRAVRKIFTAGGKSHSDPRLGRRQAQAEKGIM